MNASQNQRWRKWGLGIILPCLIAVYALSILISGETVLRRRRFGARLELRGLDAFLIGVAILSLALFLHSRCFWRESERLVNYADYVEAAAWIAFVGSLCAVIARVLLFG